MWTDLSEDTGVRVRATSADDALATAHRQGCLWGAGYDRRYLGAHAQPVNDFPTPSVTSSSHLW
jgi:hypothetical protein